MGGCAIRLIAILAYVVSAVQSLSYRCNNCNLDRIPSSISPKTTALYLQGNQIMTISKSSLNLLRNINQLDISGNELDHVEINSFSGLKITKLVLSANQLTAVPHIEPLAYSLISLHLSNNLITTIEPFTFTNFTALRELHLTANSISILPDYAFHAPHTWISRVFINRNPLAVLNNYAFAGMLANLLILDNNELTYFPCLNGIKMLLGIFLTGNPISTVPTGCGQWWRTLRRLVLSQTQITSLDTITKYTPVLEQLVAHDVSIILSDETFRNTHRLNRVIIRDVSVFPSFFASKATLLHVELGGKTVRCIEKDHLDGMNAIHTFKLWHTSVVLLPHNGCSNKSYENQTEQGYFHSLQNITIYDSNLEQFPSLHNSSRLISVELRHNKIKSVDESGIPELNTLYVLRLQQNHVTHFPNLTALGHNNSLTILELNYNRIPSIPCFPSELKLYNLVTLVITNNLISHICNINFAPNIKHLDLTNNALIGNLIVDSLNVPLLNLDTIMTRRNNIDQIKDSDLRVIPNCRMLWMEQNNIKQFPNIKLVASNAVLIDLRMNLIPDVPCSALQNMEELATLHLNHNSIRYICPHLLYLAPKLTELALIGNLLVELPDLRAPTRMQTTNVVLSGNPFRCLVAMCWMLFVPKDNPLSFDFRDTQCKDHDGIRRNIVEGLTTECTCKMFHYIPNALHIDGLVYDCSKTNGVTTVFH